MNPERWELVTEIFEAALDRRTQERGQFLAEACKGDELLREEVESLLKAHAGSEHFIATPVAETALGLMACSPDLNEAEHAQTLTGQSFLHYQIQEKLGEGGMGVVYRALDTHLDRSVAIKVLPPKTIGDRKIRLRFLREAKAASALNHPNIITIHDTATVDNIDFIVMEHVPGRGLDQLIHPGGLPLAEAIQYALQIADALVAAHGAGIIHRDLKPANIMVNPNGLVKVLDFGVAKLIHRNELNESIQFSGLQGSKSSLTQAGTLMGTDAYMSPEQVAGEPVDARSDVFSFGSLLYEMASGAKAFPGNSRTEILAAIAKSNPPPLTKVVPTLPAWLEEIVARCLEKKPDSRWQSMEEVKQALNGLSEGLRSPGSIRPWVLRNRGTVLLAAAASLLLVMALKPSFESWRTSKASGGQPVLQRVDGLGIPSIGVSPNGHWLGYIKTDSSQLCIRNLNDGEDRVIVPEYKDPDFAWSRDNRRLAILARVADRRWRLELLDWPGGIRTPLLEGSLDSNGEMPGGFSWSPDGRQLYCRFPAEENQDQIMAISTENGTQTPVFKVIGQSHGTAVSPDGRFLLYAANINSNWDIYLHPFEGGQTQEIRLTRAPSLEGAPIWSPDGRLVLFWSRSGNNTGGDLWAVRLNLETGQSAGEPFLLQTLGLPIMSTGAITDQGELFFRRTQSDAMVGVFFWNVDAETGTLLGEATTFLPSGTMAPAWSRDGKRLYYYDLSVPIVRDLETGEERKIGVPRSYVATQISTWSHNEESFTFYSWPPKGQKGFYEFFPRTGKVATLLDLDTGVNPPLSWSPDGDELLYSLWENKQDLLPVMIFRRSTGQVREITLSRDRPDPCWSPDGREIAFHDGYCLKVISSLGGESRQLVCAPRRGQRSDPDAPIGSVGKIAWSPNGRMLAWTVLNWAQRRVDVWIVDYFSGRHVEWPGEANYNSWPASLQWSPDGKQIAFERRYLRKAEIWKLSNFLP